MIGKLKQWLTERPIDKPRDEFKVRLNGMLFRPRFRCTVCDEFTHITHSTERPGGGWIVDFECPSCETDGRYKTYDGGYKLESIYPDEWGANPYDTLD